MPTFTEDFTRMRGDCDRAQKDRQRLFLEMRAGVNGMAHQVRSKLAQFTDELSATRAEIKQMAGGLRRDLTEFANDLKQGGKVFRGGPRPR